MRFLLDESADYPLVAWLRERGHDVTDIVHDYAPSLADEDVLAIAVHEGRTLITNDHDFGELIFRRRLPHAGVILFRLGSEPLSVKSLWLEYIVATLNDRLTDFIVVTDRGIRVRRTPPTQ